MSAGPDKTELARRQVSTVGDRAVAEALAAEAFRAGATSTDSDFARSIDAMWSQALQLAKQILDGELPALGERPKKRRRWRGQD